MKDENVIMFENKPFLYVNRPLGLRPDQWEELKRVSEYVFRLANETLINTINSEDIPSWITSRNDSLRIHWINKKQGINIMRIDFCWDQKNNFRAMELNACCPGGWIKTEKVCRKLNMERFGKILAPEYLFFSKYLMEKLGESVIIIALGSDYSNELEMTAEEIALLGGKCSIIDPLKVSLQEIIDHKPTGFYWKSDPLRMVKHPELIAELVNLNLPQISSFESQLIAEDKSFLTLLHEKDETGTVLKTYNLSKEDLSMNLNFFPQENSVLKPTMLTRGVDILFGKDYDPETWKSLIENAMKSEFTWLMQEAGHLRKTEDGRNGDIAVFVADGVATGAFSRISETMVTNVGKSGYHQSVVCTDNIQADLMDKIPEKIKN